MKKILFLFVLFFCAKLVFAQIPQPKNNTYINDFAGVLSTKQITHLNKNIFEIEKKYSVQMAVVLVNAIPKDYDIQDFAVLIGKKWHVGKNQRGLVYVAAIKQHKQHIEVARHLDSLFNNTTCLSIMDYMKESFRNKDYAGGLNILVDKVSLQLQDAGSSAVTKQSVTSSNSNQSQYISKGTKPTENDDTRDTWIGGIFVLVIILVIFLYIRNSKRKKLAMMREMQQNWGNQAGLYNPAQGAGNNPGPVNSGMYGNQPYQRPDHTLRNVAAGAVLGAAAGYAARSIQDHMSDHHQQQNNDFNQGNSTFASDDNDDNKSSNWGDWGGSDSNDSSYDSGFSDDSSSDSDSGSATSDW